MQWRAMRRFGVDIPQRHADFLAPTQRDDVSISVSVLLESFSAEGEHLRRLVDLELVRKANPLFQQSWTVSHVVDEESSLHGVDLDDPNDSIMGFISSMVSNDATGGQETHTRYVYEPADLRVGERFVDVIHQLSDSRLMIDYHDFHDADPVESIEASATSDCRIPGNSQPQQGPA